MGILTSKINLEKVREIAKTQDYGQLHVSDSVPAGQTKETTKNISLSFFFYAIDIVGSFTTLSLDGETIIDDGIDHLKFKLFDSFRNDPIQDELTPGSLLFTPGRRRHPGAFALGGGLPDKSGVLRFPKPFPTLFEPNTDLNIEVQNDSDTINYWDIVISGIKVDNPAVIMD